MIGTFMTTASDLMTLGVVWAVWDMRQRVSWDVARVGFVEIAMRPIRPATLPACSWTSKVGGT